MTQFKEYLRRIRDREPFAFSRLGDGEWICILNPSTSRSNKDKHIYFPELSVALGDVLRDKPKYDLGLQNHAVVNMGEQITDWLMKNNVQPSWVDADVWHKASQKGYFGDFFQAIIGRRVLMVGPKRMHKLFDNIIVVPDMNCWTDRVRIMTEIRKNMHRFDIVLFCASMASNVWIHELWKEYRDKTLLDMGSVFEVYTGTPNRAYHHEVIARLNEQVDG